MFQTMQEKHWQYQEAAERLFKLDFETICHRAKKEKNNLRNFISEKVAQLKQETLVFRVEPFCRLILENLCCFRRFGMPSLLIHKNAG